MPNERLVDNLVSDLKPAPHFGAGRDLLIISAVCIIELALFLSLGVMRPDIHLAMALRSFWWKLASVGVIAVVGDAVAVFSFDPVRSPRRGLRWLSAIVALCLAAGWFIDASRAGWGALASRLDWQGGLICVIKIVILSVPVLIGLGALMRRGAPTDVTGSAVAVGVASAAWGAFVFVFTCPYDDPLYIAVWYCVGCGLVAMVARCALPALTRW